MIDGHAVIRGLIPSVEIAAWRPVIRRVVEEVSRHGDGQGRIDDYSKLFLQVTNVWRQDEEARRIVFDRRLAGAAARLLGVESVRLYHDQALFKPPGGARTPWHRDSYYWPLATDRTVTIWLPLVDVTDEMGPVIFATGSHRLDDVPDAPISAETDAGFAALIAEKRIPSWSEPIAAGDATFHLGRTIHSAGANRSPRPREVLTIIYYEAGARIAEPANDNQRVDLEVFFPRLAPGDEAASELNPVLYPQ
ncbi:MAG TPA: phytanoyl-CoA dioxygenase family protein [Thermoanaerobaculia bacterium]|nr:phytanoyl-CoA dioxygenase family protein [Thermoanaerobaculia bacterium]